MKITIEHYDKKFVHEQPDDTDLTGTLESFKGLLISMGFHPQSVDSCIQTDSQWFPTEQTEHPFLQKDYNND